MDITKISKNFVKTASLKNIDLKINNWGIVAFAGLNGAGKSTAIRIISKHVTKGRLFLSRFLGSSLIFIMKITIEIWLTDILVY